MHSGFLSALLQYFYPRPPRGGRRVRAEAIAAFRAISIHVLREEDDGRPACGSRCGSIFLSTSSARRTTCKTNARNTFQRNFYPRPPRGGRRRPSRASSDFLIFLSTSSARRTTLKELAKLDED